MGRAPLPRCAIHGCCMREKPIHVSGQRHFYYRGDQRHGGDSFSELVQAWVCPQCPPKQLVADPPHDPGPPVKARDE